MADSDGEEDSHLAASGSYKPGSIQKIVLQNFLTYEDCVILPGSRLNIVVGANGTGKSSILNAICLGLGGEPKLLGRADDARDYVMHGKDKAFIEITLSPFPGKPAHVIQRIIDKHRGSERGQGRGASTFYLNGDKVNIKEVKELVSNTYKISIDNLCTFLPQDKVSSFSSMSEQDRLIETEKTLDGDFYNMHLELMAQEADLTDASGDLESMQQRLKKYQHENEQLERAAALVAERQKALDQAELINKKKLWVEFEALRNRALELKSAKADVKKRILEVTAQLQPLQEKEDKLAALRQKAEASHKAHNDETNRCKKEIDKQGKKFDNHDDRIEDMLTQLSEIDSKRSQAEAEVKAKQDRVNAMENNLKTIPSLQEADAELKEAQAKRRETAKKHDRAKRNEQEIDHQIKELEEQGQHYQQKLARLENVVDARKRQVFRQFGNLSKISQMIEPERGSFRRQVWGPVACEIDAKSQDIAGMLEQHVPNAAFKTFVVEEKRDYDRLYKWIRLDKSIPININVVHNGELKPVRRIYSDKKMAILKQQHGIQGYLDECFTAPDAIMQFLRSSAAVHRVLVGNTKTMDSINKKGLLDYLAEPEHGHEKVSYCVFAMNGRTIRKYSGTVSKYSHKIAMAQDEILDPRFLSAGVDDSEKQQVGAKLSEIHEQADSLRPKVQEAQHIRRQLEAEAQEASGETEAAQKKKAQIVKFHEKHKQAKRQLREAIAGLDTDDNETKKSLVTSLTNSVSNSITALISHARQQEIMLTSTIAGAGAAANKSSVAAAATEARNALQEKKMAHAEIENEARRIQTDFSTTKKLAGEKKVVAEKEAPLVDADGNETELKAQLEAITLDNVNELQCAYEEAMAKANDIADNPNAIRQYEQRKRDIEELEAELQHRLSLEAGKIEHIKQLSEKWENGLTQRVAEVNKLFTTYMAEMGCTGEVVLSKGNTDRADQDAARSYKDWGIQILVSFRGQAKAQALSAERNSGGERSVCTIMYLMALQEMMVAPFRCVDEINQGLDERNERLVFRRIVANSCRAPTGDDATEHCGQYFLITPKLLPNLTDMEHEAASVLFVMNGPHCYEKPDDWQDYRTGKSDRRRNRGENDEEENSSNTASQSSSKRSRRS